MFVPAALAVLLSPRPCILVNTTLSGLKSFIVMNWKPRYNHTGPMDPLRRTMLSFLPIKSYPTALYAAVKSEIRRDCRSCITSMTCPLIGIKSSEIFKQRKRWNHHWYTSTAVKSETWVGILTIIFLRTSRGLVICLAAPSIVGIANGTEPPQDEVP